MLQHLSGNPCADCGEADPVVLEFDHVTAKTANVGSLVQMGAAPSRLALEIARCEVVCVNCHRLRTATRRETQPARVDARHPARARNAAFVRERLLRIGCRDCGCRNLAVLDFDHLAEKAATVSELVRRECSLQRLEEEMDKCQVRCANCHRRRTAAMFGHYRHKVTGELDGSAGAA